MAQDDDLVDRVYDKFCPILDDYKRLKEVLQQATSAEITIMLDNWNWVGCDVAWRMFLEERDRRQELSRSVHERLNELLNIDSDKSEPAIKAREVLRQANGPRDPTVVRTPQAQEEQPVDRPSWWQEHKNQIYVGLLVGIPGVIVGPLVLILG